MKKVSVMDNTRDLLLANRFNNHGLLEPFTSPEELLEKSLGIQAQYLNHALFNIAIRLPKDQKETFEKLAQNAILAWGQRQTYHFFAYEQWKAICRFLDHQKLWPENYLSQEGHQLEELQEQLANQLLKPVERQVLLENFQPHSKVLFQWSALFLLHSRKGQLYHKWYPQAEDRLVFWDNLPSEANLDLESQLLEAYFAFYGPATLSDAAHFFGLKLSEITNIPLPNSKSLSFNKVTYYYQALKPEIDLPNILVIGKFDPLLVAYHHKDLLIPPSLAPLVWKKAGQISALILKKGQLQATWTFKVSKKDIRFTVNYLKAFSKKDKKEIEKVFSHYCQMMKRLLHSVTYEEIV
ncbi:hypothetical protein AT575_01900 [Streptococcus penaeicida]|uniref:Winged helix DNA-binding domain-containing protein n=2 Tax=Streptococcus penaeicida TaxID=1765960 RepID=A0A2N8LDT4_9STRE|nr:hypothetical protein AT575_01900 [Streptococcus penaeicida]